MFRIIFVLDILYGKVVHAVRGERAKYKPVKGSQICDSSCPLDMISILNPQEVYIADLDRLQHLCNNFGVIKEISRKTKTMTDIGVQSMDDVEICAAISDFIILGTETTSLELIENAARKFPGRINVSVDMKNGKIITKDKRIELRPEELVKKLNDYNISAVIILELTRVGTSQGIDAAFLKEIAVLSKHDILVGGGIKDMEDIEALERIGIRGALVATAVHNGKIPVQFIRQSIHFDNHNSGRTLLSTFP